MKEAAEVARLVNKKTIEQMADELVALRMRRGTLFMIGLGGSAANCSHAASDLRKACRVRAVCLTDNTAELTAYINDYGLDGVFANMLVDHRATPQDALFVLSVSGVSGTVSRCLAVAVDKARSKCMRVLGVVGRDGGYVKKAGDCVVLIPTVSPDRVTAHTEAFHMVVMHLLVSHPKLIKRLPTW